MKICSRESSWLHRWQTLGGLLLMICECVIFVTWRWILVRRTCCFLGSRRKAGGSLLDTKDIGVVCSQGLQMKCVFFL